MPVLIHLASPTVRGDLTAAGQRPGADSGDPQISTLAIDNGTTAQTGIWESEPGGWPVINRPDTEVFYVISGRAQLTDEDTGRTTDISAGSYVILPKGWSGRWDVIETIRKAYVVF